MVDAGSTLADRYELTGRIASGGMGTVYEAEDARLHRTVAIKLLKTDLAGDPRFVERFRREARAAAALSHPNVCAVFDYGEDAEQSFIVMEHARGKDLARVMREEGPLSADRATRIAAQVCDALEHAHAGGIVHRDVKPANVIVGPSDRVKVTDFGIARAAGDSTLTTTGSVLGTAHYLSPEQASGGKVTAASDVYSLGVVLYEMLTGSVPFTGDSPIAVAMRHVSEDVPAPSELNPDVPPQLDEIVARATAKEPERRFASAAEMGAALRSAVGRRTDEIATEPVGAAAAAGAAGTTAVIGGGDTAPAVWPIPGDRWDPQRIGRIVVIAFAILLLVAALLLLFRLIGDGEPAAERTPRRERPAGAAGGADEPSTPEGYTIPDEIIGMKKDEAKGLLEPQGVTVEESRVDSTAEKDTVVEVQPPPGTVVQPGDVVTLFVSAGERAEDKGDGEGNGEGKGNDKGKGKED